MYLPCTPNLRIGNDSMTMTLGKIEKTQENPGQLPLIVAVLLSMLLVVSCGSPPTPLSQSTEPQSPVPRNQVSTPEVLPTVNVGPEAVPIWQPDHFVDRTQDASIAIHKIVISSDVITLVYSIELAHADSGKTVMVSPTAILQGERPDHALMPTLARVLYSGVDVSLGALSFGPYSSDSLYYRLVIPELSVVQMSDRSEMTVQGPWTIPVMKRHEDERAILPSWFPHLYWDGRSHSDRNDVKVRHNPVGYEGDSEIGWVVTSGFYFLDRPVYFMVKADGDVVEISEEWYVNIDELLNKVKQPN